MIHYRLVLALQVERGEDAAEEQPVAEVARDEAGMLALPAEPGLGGEGFFHHRCGIDEDFHFAAIFLGNEAGELLQFFLDDVVIILVERIAGDIADRFIGELL